MENTIYGFKHLLGKTADDKCAIAEIRKLNYNASESEFGRIGVQVNYRQAHTIFQPEQILAMLFTKLKSEFKDDKADVILTVPTYFTSSERQALLNSASIARLNCLQLLNETTAIALNYGYYKQEEFAYHKPRNVVFMDFGHTSLQVSVVSFTAGKLQVLATTSIMIGGRDIDQMLADHFCNEFNQKYHIDPREDKKALARLMVEVEKLKKLMSINKTNLKLKIDNFMGREKVEAAICRDIMENICVKLFEKLHGTAEKCIAKSELKAEDIHSIEITGGSSRIPKFKQMVEEIFMKAPSTTLNQDEAVAKGGAIYCSMQSERVKMQHKIKIIDVLSNNPVNIILKCQENNDIDAAVLFDEVTDFPFTKKTALAELKSKDLPTRMYLTNVNRPMTLDSWICKFGFKLQFFIYFYSLHYNHYI